MHYVHPLPVYVGPDPRQLAQTSAQWQLSTVMQILAVNYNYLGTHHYWLHHDHNELSEQ